MLPTASDRNLLAPEALGSTEFDRRRRCQKRVVEFDEYTVLSALRFPLVHESELAYQVCSHSAHDDVP